MTHHVTQTLAPADVIVPLGSRSGEHSSLPIRADDRGRWTPSGSERVQVPSVCMSFLCVFVVVVYWLFECALNYEYTRILNILFFVCGRFFMQNVKTVVSRSWDQLEAREV